ncbi:MAG TPA: PAAR domain-containing protein [Luteimonas sp.]|nr:PAAR domain-containing protein [Luteimonas sp.]HRO26498.1 PAAR domain-containing protein [Luteimonas sp.]HRP72948.1 PAAR domain-containing protein [Luteimonas sp.]
MSRPFIVLGDALSHGGTVTSASEHSDVGGRRIARVGDACVCSKHGPTRIASGDPTIVIDGKAVARRDDVTECGATLVPSQATTGVR